MSCFDSQVIQRITAIALDECGRIPTTEQVAAPAIKGLKECITNVTRSRQVDQPAEQVIKNVAGGTCQKPRPSATDRGYNYTVTFCGSNPVFEAITGYKTLIFDGANIVGWRDRQLSGVTKVALEIVFFPSADACVGEGDIQTPALLIPLLETWVRSGDEAYDGENVPDLQMSASTSLNRQLFANFANAAALPTYLAHWAPEFTAIGAGADWSYTLLIDQPAEEPDANCCALVALDEAS